MLQVRKNNDIQASGFTLEKNRLTPVGNPTFKDWEEIGKFIERSSESVQFWRGDWLNYGENTYDQWSQYFGDDKTAYQTLANEKYVSHRIAPERRRDTLTWSHHREVADLEPEEQEEMLSMAEKNGMTVAVFRKAVRHYKLKLDLPELMENELEKTDPEVFKAVQSIIDSSIRTIESIEQLPWDSVHIDARDYLLSHLRRAATYYLEIATRYHDRQKRLSE
jgi:hypothetical protein